MAAASFFLTRLPSPSFSPNSLSLHPCRNPKSHISFSFSPSLSPIVVVGSANADIYVEIDRLPLPGETLSAFSGKTLPGGKGANQAFCAGKLTDAERKTYLIGRVGNDAHGRLLEDSLGEGGVVCLDRLVRDAAAPTGHAVVMLQPDGQNSIIIVGGANMNGWDKKLSDEDLKVVKSAKLLILQREIPDWVNIQVAQAAKEAGVTIIMDAGGMDAPIPSELISLIDIFSPNETELARLTNIPTGNFEQIEKAALKCHNMGVKQVIVKLGSQGSALFTEGEQTLKQGIIKASKVVDTTGAGDTFTAAFGVALVEGKSKQQCLRFAAAAASLCVQVKGAMPSMPNRNSVMDLLRSV